MTICMFEENLKEYDNQHEDILSRELLLKGAENILFKYSFPESPPMFIFASPLEG